MTKAELGEARWGKFSLRTKDPAFQELPSPFVVSGNSLVIRI